MVLSSVIELFVLDLGVNLNQSCQEYWIGGSTNVTAPPSPKTNQVSYFDYIANNSGDYILFCNEIMLSLKMKTG